MSKTLSAADLTFIKARTFSDTDLARTGVTSPDVPLPNLENEIHLIFDRSRWCAYHSYPQFVSTLQLASRFLTDDKYLPWWCTISSQRELENHPPQRGCRTQWKIRPIEPTPARLEATRHKLTALAQHVSFRFLHPSRSTAETPAKTELDTTNEPAKAIIIHLSTHLCDVLLKPNSELLPTDQRMRIELHLATLLCRELCHAILLLDFHPPTTKNTFPTIDINQLPRLELRNGFDQTLFGGSLQPIDSDPETLRGLCIRPDPRPQNTIALPMSFIARFFSEECWVSEGEMFTMDYDLSAKAAHPRTVGSVVQLHGDSRKPQHYLAQLRGSCNRHYRRFEGFSSYV